MKMIFMLAFLVVVSFQKANAQASYFDAATISEMINLNKNEFSHKDTRRENAIEIEAETTTLKSEAKKLSELKDKLNDRLQSIFVLLADADLVYNVAKEVTVAYDYQSKAIDIAAHHPALSIIVVQYNAGITQHLKKMIAFFALIVGTYSEVSKMEPAKRKTIYNEVWKQVHVCRLRSEGMYYAIKGNNLLDFLKKTKEFGYFKQDQYMLNQIINNLQNAF